MIEEGTQLGLSPHLLNRDKEFDIGHSPPANSEEIIQDLGMNVIFESMAKGDRRIKDISQKVVLQSTTDVAEIDYRQNVLRDAVKNKNTVFNLFQTLTGAIDKARRNLFWFGRLNVEYSLHDSISTMEYYVNVLEYLRRIAETQSKDFESEGFRNLFYQFINEFDDNYIRTIKEHLMRLKFPNGVKILERLGKSCEPADFRLVLPEIRRGIGYTVVKIKEKRYTYALPEQDEAGYQELENMKTRSLTSVTLTLGYAADNLLNFINTLTTELAFLVGCINLYDDIERMGGSIAFPDPKPLDNSILSFKGLYDVALFLKLNGQVVANDFSKGNWSLTIITGANRGGKSTFLRSIGQSLLMMQAGMFIGGKKFSSSTFNGVYTHFKREEEKEMTVGKFDEELERLSRMVDQMRHGSIALFNESFAATNAIEGSQIAGQIIKGLTESGVTVVFVTHLYELAELFLNEPSTNVRFLVAERLDNGERTYKIIQGIPTATSYGEDLYRRIFNQEV